MRHISLTLRGFNVDPREIVECFEVVPERFGTKGERTNPVSQARFRNSFVFYALPRRDDEAWGESLVRLVDSLGGVEQLHEVIKRFRPRFIEVDVTVPVRSELYEGGGFTAKEVAILSTLKASLSVGIYSPT